MSTVQQVPIIDWNDLAIEFLASQHRTPRFIAWQQGMIGQNAWLNKNFWNYCYGDSTSNPWSSTTTYSLNSTVITYQGVYISVEDSGVIGSPTRFNNIGNNPDTTPSAWYKIAPTYIGAQERAQYNSQKLVMEYALNRWFRTTFRQPTAYSDGTSSSPLGIWYTPTSDIFITTVPSTLLTFLSGENEASSSASSDIGSGTYYSTETVVTGLDTTYKFIVWIPTSLSVALGVSYVQIVSSVVNKMLLAGTIFSISIY